MQAISRATFYFTGAGNVIIRALRVLCAMCASFIFAAAASAQPFVNPAMVASIYLFLTKREQYDWSEDSGEL